MQYIRHECQQLKEYDTSQNNGYLIEPDKEYFYGWRFELTKYANKEAVENSQAEYVGEEISKVIISIQYCPFCGLNLHDLER